MLRLCCTTRTLRRWAKGTSCVAPSLFFPLSHLKCSHSWHLLLLHSLAWFSLCFSLPLLPPLFSFLLLSLLTNRLDGNGILLMAVDNLPAQLPREATDFFGSKLLPFIPDCVSLWKERDMKREETWENQGFICHYTLIMLPSVAFNPLILLSS